MVAGGVGPLLLHIITTSRHSVPCLMGPRFYFLAIVHWSTVYNAGQLQSVLQSRGAKHIMATIVAATPWLPGSKIRVIRAKLRVQKGQKKLKKEESNESRAMAPLLKKSNYDRTNQ